MGKLHTTESAAIFLGVSPSRIRQLILEKRLQSEKYGRDHLISESALQAFKTSGKRKVGRKPKK
jgi:site-specific DNA-methyltransferase (adenine-specific)